MRQKPLPPGAGGREVPPVLRREPTPRSLPIFFPLGEENRGVDGSVPGMETEKFTEVIKTNDTD